MLMALGMSVFFGCKGEDADLDLVDILEQEKKDIHIFLTEQSHSAVTAIPYYNLHDMLIDSLFIFNNSNQGNLAGEKDVVLYDYSLKRLDGRFLDAGIGAVSADPEVIGDSLLYLYGGPVYYIPDTNKKYDYIGKAFQHIAEGKEGEMVVPSVLMDKSGMARHYTLKVRKIISNIFEYEKDMIQRFLVKNVVEGIDPVAIEGEIEAEGEAGGDEEGEGEGEAEAPVAYVMVTYPGAGERTIEEGDVVTVYSAMYLVNEDYLEGKRQLVIQTDTVNATAFKAADFSLSVYAEALQYLKEGDVAELVIPYNMGYGTKNTYYGDSKLIAIPGYTTLGIEIEVVKVIPPEDPEEPEPENPDPEE